MRDRFLAPELMDDPGIARAEHHSALAGLQRLNRWTRNASLLWPTLRELATERDDQPLRVLDIATGAGDIPIQLALRAQSAGLDLEFEACDVSHEALAFARENCSRAEVDIKLFSLDAISDPIEARYDVVFCSQFLHHLPDSQAIDVLAKMIQSASRRVIVVDLVRSRWNWLQVWMATRLLSRSPIVHFDGPQSIRAAFQLSEVQRLARDAGCSDFRIRSSWPCRFVLIERIHEN